MVEQNIISDFVEAIKQDPVERNTVHSAEVSRIDSEGTVWVRVAGSEKETPTASSAAEVKKGDAVNVEWRNNKLYISGNYSNPSAGVFRVSNVEHAAQIAKQAASNAVADAGVARTAAESAQASATEAKTIAEGVSDIAEQAKKSADSAMKDLATVEQVVNVVTWLAEHAEYEQTQDTQVIDGKYYFEYDSTTQKYAVVIPQEGDNPSEEGWYEVSKIDETISNFIGSHMALVEDGLWIQNGTSRIFLSLTSGMELWSNGKKVATYGSSAIIGAEDGFHIKVSPNELGFFQGAVRVAYINGSKLYITQSVVLQQMDIGRLTGDVDPITGEVGKGQWSWKVHEINGQNNLYLKWLG